MPHRKQVPGGRITEALHDDGATLLLAHTGNGCCPDVRVEQDIPYLGAGRAEKLDLYMPAMADKGQRFRRSYCKEPVPCCCTLIRMS